MVVAAKKEQGERFRSLPKERLQILLPVAVLERLRVHTARSGRPPNEAITKILISGMRAEAESRRKKSRKAD